MRTSATKLAWLLVAVAVPAAAQFNATPPEELVGEPVMPARLPDGKPNWTGFWVPPSGSLDVYRGRAA